jgi:hypothetical protein
LVLAAAALIVDRFVCFFFHLARVFRRCRLATETVGVTKGNPLRDLPTRSCQRSLLQLALPSAVEESNFARSKMVVDTFYL